MQIIKKFLLKRKVPKPGRPHMDSAPIIEDGELVGCILFSRPQCGVEEDINDGSSPYASSD